jgi:hypothetical protein
LILKLRCKDKQVLEIITTFVQIISVQIFMFILNITFLISRSQVDPWLVWTKNDLIPYMLASGLLSDPQLARVVGQEEDGLSYALQFRAHNRRVLEQWSELHANGMQQLCSERFGNSALFFSTVLELQPLA